LKTPIRRTVLALAATLAAACSPSPDVGAIPPFESCEVPALEPGELVLTEARSFVRGDGETMPHGINSYPLLQHVGDDRIDAVRDILGQANALGRPLLRTPGYMDGGDNPARIRDDDGTIREQGLAALDRVLAEAADHGVRLLLTLTNNWEGYGGARAVVDAVAPGEGLPKDAFWSEPRAVAAQVEYVQTIASRTNTINGRLYATDPTVLGWELCNEARCDDPDWCDAATLSTWAATMSAILRGAGAEQPIFWGGAGYLGQHGEDLREIAAHGGVDVLTAHVYLHYSDPWLYQLPQAERVAKAIDIGAGIVRERAEVALDYGLPLVIEELGWKVAAAGLRDAERAAVYEGWLAVAHDEGLATMPWMIGETDRPDYDGLLIRPTDHLTWEVIACH
jgi:endo-1,4-beta-mannosidase